MAVALPATQAPPGTPRRRALALVVLAFAQLMIVLDASVVVVALPSAQHALHISVADRQWVMTSYTLAFGTLLLLGGRVADYFGRRRTFVTGLLGFVAASALGGLAQTPAMLFGARALQGAFAAMMAPSALALLTTTFTEARERARAFGVYGAVAGSGAALGLVLGGTLTQFTSWRWTLLINVPIGLVTAVAARRLLVESRGHDRRGYDLPGAATITGSLFLLVYGFTVAGTDGWSSPLTVGLLATAVAGLALFVVLELRAAHPLLPMRVVLDRNRGGAYLASLLVGSAMLGMFLFLTYFFQGILGYTPLRTGFAFLPFSAGIITGASVASRVLPRVGARRLMVTGMVTAALGMLWFVQLHVGSAYATHILPAEIVVSVGMGLTFVPMSSTALVGVDPADAGVASALVNTQQQVGSSLGTALLNTVAATATASFLAAHVGVPGVARAAAVHGYTTGFTLSTALIAGGAIVAAVLIRTPKGATGAVATGATGSTAEPDGGLVEAARPAPVLALADAGGRVGVGALADADDLAG